MKKILVTIVLIIVAFFSLFLDDEEDTSTGGGGNTSSTNTNAEQTYDAENTTLLIYMIGSDLESEGQCASADLEEIANADLSDNLNIVIQTGGTKSWATSGIDGKKVQRFSLTSDGLELVDTVGKCKSISMADPGTLADFLSWGIENYPADRYGVIFWNHGGGSASGFGSDEYHTDDSLEINEMAKAFKKADAYVNFIGFDACLMGTIETAYALSPYADYLIASEESEPGTGWYYTNWISMLAKDPTVSMKKLSTKLIDDFVDGPDSSFWDDYTLALLDLSDVPSVYTALCNYLSESRNVLMSNGFSQLADARSSVKSYGDDQFEQVDILSYIDKAGIEDDELVSALNDMIVYYKGNISDSTGLALYYPYSYPDYYSTMYEVMDSINMNNENHLGYFNDFVSILSGGQRSKKSGASISSIQQLTNTTDSTETTAPDYSDANWYNADAAENNVDTSALFDPEENLALTEQADGNFILDLTDEQWKSISKVEMELYLGDGEGYTFYGLDSLVHYDDNGDLMADFDFTWVSINGQLAPFFIISDEEDGDKWRATGYVPAILNADTDKEQDVNIYIRWDNEHENGYVMGYTVYKIEDEGMSVPPRNYLSFKAGDTLDLYSDYYTADGEFEDSYYIGDTIKITDEDLVVSYEEIADDIPVEIGYKLTDMYQNEYWTEVLQY